jgi:ABC-type oligopeptide transport system substrate-binding subunit
MRARNTRAQSSIFPKDRIGIQYWDFNCKLPEFLRPARVRQAFSYAIDRKAVLMAVNLTRRNPGLRLRAVPRSPR